MDQTVSLTDTDVRDGLNATAGLLYAAQLVLSTADSEVLSSRVPELLEHLAEAAGLIGSARADVNADLSGAGPVFGASTWSLHAALDEGACNAVPAGLPRITFAAVALVAAARVQLERVSPTCDARHGEDADGLMGYALQSLYDLRGERTAVPASSQRRVRAAALSGATD